MPLNQNALKLIRANLEVLKKGGRPPFVSIGYLSVEQHQAINDLRQREGRPLLENPEILFMGRHLYTSRSADGYTIDDMLAMIASALSADSIAVPHAKMTGLVNYTHRLDAYGSQVQDLAVFELYAKRPKAELFSVIPKGDKKPKDIQK
ncbi:hypothetical protein HSX11_20805 [Oxalobacteraceae bacterium]|nr:hypothetical protein [Oxalobacteraceae bacterium]